MFYKNIGIIISIISSLVMFLIYHPNLVMDYFYKKNEFITCNDFFQHVNLYQQMITIEYVYDELITLNSCNLENEKPYMKFRMHGISLYHIFCININVPFSFVVYLATMQFAIPYGVHPSIGEIALLYTFFLFLKCSLW